MKDCHVEREHKQITSEERAETTEAALEIFGMGCPNCANRVHNSLLKLRGVMQAQVDHLSGMGLVRFNPTMASTNQLIEAVSDAGRDSNHRYHARLGSEA